MINDIYIYIYIPYWLFPIGYSLWAPVSHIYMYTNIMGRVCICIHVYIYIHICIRGALGPVTTDMALAKCIRPIHGPGLQAEVIIAAITAVASIAAIAAMAAIATVQLLQLLQLLQPFVCVYI